MTLDPSSVEFSVSGWFRANARRICVPFFLLAAVVPTIAEAQTQLLIPRNRLDEAIPAPNHVRFVYAVPVDGWDRILDMDGTLQAAVVVAQKWMAERADGMTLRVRMVDGRPEILFVRLDIQQDTVEAANRTSEERSVAFERLRHQIELQLRRDRRVYPNEIYAVLYDGIHFGGCGIAAPLPKPQDGVVVMLNLQRYSSSMAFSCSEGVLASPQKSTPYPERALIFHIGLLHEVFHGLGAVPYCAPDRVAPNGMRWASATKGSIGHDNVNPHDLMYTPPTPDSPRWVPTEIDAKRRNYFGHGRPDCLDIAKSPFLVRGK